MTTMEAIEAEVRRNAARRAQWCAYGFEYLTTAPFPNGFADCPSCGRQNLKLTHSRLPRHYQAVRGFFHA